MTNTNTATATTRPAWAEGLNEFTMTVIADHETVYSGPWYESDDAESHEIQMDTLLLLCKIHWKHRDGKVRHVFVDDELIAATEDCGDYIHGFNFTDNGLGVYYSPEYTTVRHTAFRYPSIIDDVDIFDSVNAYFHRFWNDIEDFYDDVVVFEDKPEALVACVNGLEISVKDCIRFVAFHLQFADIDKDIYQLVDDLDEYFIECAECEESLAEVENGNDDYDDDFWPLDRDNYDVLDEDTLMFSECAF